MRESFRKHLMDLHKANIKQEEFKNNNLEEKAKQVDMVINYYLDDASEENETDMETQLLIHDIQKRKNDIMKKLRSDMHDCNDPEIIPPFEEGMQKITKEDDTYYVEAQDGSQQEINIGEIMTDHEWGLNYYLDPQSVDPKTRKKLLIEKARSEIQELFDEQIMINEINSSKVHHHKKSAYEALQEMKKSKIETGGHIAEKLVKNFLKKICINHDVEFQLEEADVFQDVEQKIDFIITRKRRTRGVGIEKDEAKTEHLETNHFGIQFTTNTSAETISRKNKQIIKAQERMLQEQDESLDDIALVSMNLGSMKRKFLNWQETKHPGGPEKLINTTFKKNIVDKVLKNILTEEEIDTIKKYIDPLHGEQMGVIKEAS